jgi:hypothetical protein
MTMHRAIPRDVGDTATVAAPGCRRSAARAYARRHRTTVTPVNQLLLLDSVEGIQTRPNSCQRFDDLIRAGHGGRQLVIGDPRIDSLF